MKKVFSLFTLLLFFGCQNSIVFEKTKQFEGHRWNRFVFIETDFEITDIDKLYDLQLNLVNRTTYAYDYISLNITLYLPDETMRSRDIEIRLQDKNLNWLGTVNGDLVTTSFSYIKGMKFQAPGKVRLRIENKMSILNLEEVERLQVKVMETR
jgi:gliding motility-associated lipoprotein GldH